MMNPFQQSAFGGADNFSSTGRQRFHVDLKDSTNVVSWKKLLKYAPPPPTVDPPPGANPALEARLAPEAALLAKEPRGASNRFSNVIEKIERLYQGHGQESDDEMVDNKLDDVPDDDQYNTDDSFIDDQELDEYFSVEKAKTKHTGFFINKGKLENITDPSPPPVVMPKKRKRKDVKTSDVQVGDCSKKMKPVVKQESENHLATCMVNIQSQQAANGSEQNKILSKTPDYNTKAMSPVKVERAIQRPKCISGSPSKAPAITNETLNKRTGAPKITLLERAIQDLKAAVTQHRASAPEVQETEQPTNAPGKVKRLPREIKQKMAKVARLASKQGKIPDELIDRLMSILGDSMQLKTLKRNLKEMVEMGLVAKQEKEGRLSHMKKEFSEMVRSKLSSQAKPEEERFSDDFQGNPGSSDKTNVYQWDHATEDRICDLYDQYLEGTDENKAVQSKKLYTELAELWPAGWMDKDGIKSAVARSKERKKALFKQTVNESRKKMAERIDLNERAPEACLGLTPTTVRDLPSNLVQSGKPAIIRKQQQMQRAMLLEKQTVEYKDKNSLVTEAGKLSFLKFRKQKGGTSEEGLVEPGFLVSVEGSM